MSRMQRVKDALASTVSKVSAEIKALQEAGKTPAGYSLGFANGLIFANHHINMNSGEPHFFNVTTSIGTLPKPQPLKSADELAAEQEYEYLVDKILTDSRTMLAIWNEPGLDEGEVMEKLRGEFEELHEHFTNLDAFIDEQVKLDEAGPVEAGASPDAGGDDQEGATPSPASPNPESQTVPSP